MNPNPNPNPNPTRGFDLTELLLAPALFLLRWTINLFLLLHPDGKQVEEKLLSLLADVESPTTNPPYFTGSEKPFQ